MARDPNDFSFAAALGHRRQNPYKGPLITGAVVLGLCVVFYWLYKQGEKGWFDTGGMSRIGAGNVLVVSDEDLGYEYNGNEKKADERFKNRWLQVSGECSDIHASRPPEIKGVEVWEGQGFELGKRTTRFGEDWIVEGHISRGADKEFAKVEKGGTLTVVGRCVGKLGGQVVLVDCHFVDYKP